MATRRGVEGYVEPRTAVTETTIVLVAADGEWTRRRIDGPDVARRLSRDLAIPVYDAQVTGYPQRMRDWSARQKNDRPGTCAVLPHRGSPRDRPRGGPVISLGVILSRRCQGLDGRQQGADRDAGAALGRVAPGRPVL